MEPPVCRSSSIDLPTTRTGPVWSHRAAALFFVLYTPTRVWCACGRGVRSDTLRVARVAARDLQRAGCAQCSACSCRTRTQEAWNEHMRARRALASALGRALSILCSMTLVLTVICIVTRDSCVCVCMFHVHLQASTFLFLILLCLEP